MLGTVIRFIVAALAIQLTDFLVPGFRVGGFLYALLAAIVISLAGRLIESLFRVSPRSRGVVGFLVAAATIYLTQFLVPAFDVTIVGALIASLIIGIIDSLVPVEVR